MKRHEPIRVQAPLPLADVQARVGFVCGECLGVVEDENQEKWQGLAPETQRKRLAQIKARHRRACNRGKL